MYGLVFDNTFSKTVSKAVTFVLLTYVTGAAPSSHAAPGGGIQGEGGKSMAMALGGRPNMVAAGESVDSFHSHAQSVDSSRGTSSAGKPAELPVPTFHVGTLHKRRRKRGQGYARRYFSLDFQSCTLSYYYNRNSSALRGAIPLSLAAIAADERRREISIDSGAEIWHLKASNTKDFQEWTKALEAASNKARGNIQQVEEVKKPGMPPRLHTRTNSMYKRPMKEPSEEDREWDQVESLVSRIVGTRDAVRRLVDDTKPRAQAQRQEQQHLNSGSCQPSPSVPEEGSDYFEKAGSMAPPERRPFWKRKASSNSVGSNSNKQPGSRTASVTAQLGASMSTQMSPALPATAHHTHTPSMHTGVGQAPVPGEKRLSQHPSPETGDSIHHHCKALLSDLDVVLADFNSLITKSKQRRFPPQQQRPLYAPRASMDSTCTDEFFDAEEGDPNDSQHFIMHSSERNEDESLSADEEEDEHFQSGDDGESVASDLEDEEPVSNAPPFFPPKPKSLAPLPISTAPARRTTIKPAMVAPPSLISFLRKNVGKDLSTISMPVSANEPTSGLQRLAECMEYAELLDAAATHPQPHMRHLLLTAFAISALSANRVKERSIRKPFNPMLGETYELVRASSEVPGNFRFVAEKVSHRPVKMACQADGQKWSLTQSSKPVQKFWGKSAELITEGRVHVVLRLGENAPAGGGDECYSWPIPTMFLRNVVMGEKYVEPVGHIAVLNETTGASCSVDFKATKGMWGGRSEELEAHLMSPDGRKTQHGLIGNWTSSLSLTENGKSREVLWKVGELVKGAENRYGMPVFGAQLNEITEIEKGKCAITDSRLRADQRLAEDGNLDQAEVMKTKLEEAQRDRRRQMEQEGREWTPRWFELDPTVKGVLTNGAEGEAPKGEECWKLKTGMRGYWEERQGGKWFGVEDVLLVGSHPVH